MINIFEVKETNNMITQENLDVRTITLGISLLDCITDDLEKLNENIYRKITTVAKDLVSTGEDIEREFGIPIVNKRISVTPDRARWRKCLQMPGGLCDDRKDAGSCSQEGRRQLPWRLFCACIKGNDQGG
ncbi:MAG: DUF711 family protein [Lachnospiraceae bacterium]